jgi:hypothetical protein
MNGNEVAKQIKALLSNNRSVPFSELMGKDNLLMTARIDAQNISSRI